MHIVSWTVDTIEILKLDTTSFEFQFIEICLWLQEDMVNEPHEAIKLSLQGILKIVLDIQTWYTENHTVPWFCKKWDDSLMKLEDFKRSLKILLQSHIKAKLQALPELAGAQVHEYISLRWKERDQIDALLRLSRSKTNTTPHISGTFHEGYFGVLHGEWKLKSATDIGALKQTVRARSEGLFPIKLQNRIVRLFQSIERPSQVEEIKSTLGYWLGERNYEEALASCETTLWVLEARLFELERDVERFKNNRPEKEKVEWLIKIAKRMKAGWLRKKQLVLGLTQGKEKVQITLNGNT
jgi:hypothetical protein